MIVHTMNWKLSLLCVGLLAAASGHLLVEAAPAQGAAPEDLMSDGHPDAVQHHRRLQAVEGMDAINLTGSGGPAEPGHETRCIFCNGGECPACYLEDPNGICRQIVGCVP
ncbi:hypothetical protein FHG87_006006 [Trinorchestia longiramus]|nr:hypothetical protein FHG87_006006 [Trinorchestia longiramus]